MLALLGIVGACFTLMKLLTYAYRLGRAVEANESSKRAPPQPVVIDSAADDRAAWRTREDYLTYHFDEMKLERDQARDEIMKSVRRELVLSGELEDTRRRLFEKTEAVARLRMLVLENLGPDTDLLSELARDDSPSPHQPGVKFMELLESMGM